MNKKPVTLTDTELDILDWAVDGQALAANADPEEFQLGDWEDLRYRIDDQYRDMVDDESQNRDIGWKGRMNRSINSLLAKLQRAPDEDRREAHGATCATDPCDACSTGPRWVFNDGGRLEAGYQGRTGDCVVRAVSIAARLPYQKVYEDLHARIKNSRLRKHRKSSPRDGIRKEIGRQYLESLGWSWVPTMKIGSGCRVHLRREELPGGRLIVQASKHLVAVIDGVIHDTYDPSRDGTRCVYGYWVRK